MVLPMVAAVVCSSNSLGKDGESEIMELWKSCLGQSQGRDALRERNDAGEYERSRRDVAGAALFFISQLDAYPR